ncbi:glucosamine-6-phosphate deaminase [Halalkalibacter alkalisediminis]|uniref:Glucosamine-6-phosphate deaminase n=1 Tax=Halalkalibacter alkalisediminis TaxID=935616 RepID=A0ABV6NIY8_9BACI|nr:glucosamine-6-phosphate deaminase [Halalkalibacter alkalisediminis]
MKLIKVKDYQEMSSVASNYISNQVRKHNPFTLGLATGGTPKKTYELLIDDHKNNGTSYSHVTTFNLDEYIGLTKEDSNSYHYYMKHALFKYIDINPKNIFIPDGLSENIEQECAEYEQKIRTYGGVNLQLLGIGANGHIGFNEPGTPFSSQTHVVELTPSTRTANARYFNSIKHVPTHAITMGIASIMASKEILLLVSGEEKSQALKHLLSDEAPTENFPASILRKHPCVTIIADIDALKDLDEKGVSSLYTMLNL